MSWDAPAPSSVLAAASTLHVALALLRKHRCGSALRGWLLGGASALFAAAPWIWASPRELAIGAAAHAAWFLATARLAGGRPTAAPLARSAVSARVVAPAAPSARVPPAAPRPAGPVAAPVLAVFDETPEIRTFRVARPEGFEFRAGQFLTVQVQLDGKPVARCYSISSSPESRGYLEISVRRQGRVSRTLHSAVVPGSVLWIRPAAGAFVYPSGDDRRLVLVSGGVGCTPLISMLRHAIAHEPGRPVLYLHSARTEADVAFREELALIARRHPQVRIVLALTRSEAIGGHYPGRIDARLLREVVPDAAEGLFYVCGPAGMISSVREALHAMGVPREQVRSEAFEAAVAASRSVPAAAEPAEPPASRVLTAKRTHAVRLSRSGRIASATSERSLLEAAEDARVEIPNLCRAGTCGTCRTRLVSGDVECEAAVMDDEDRRAGYVFPCVAWARSDCELDA